MGGDLPVAVAGQSVTITLEDEVAGHDAADRLETLPETVEDEAPTAEATTLVAADDASLADAGSAAPIGPGADGLQRVSRSQGCRGDPWVHHQSAGRRRSGHARPGCHRR